MAGCWGAALLHLLFGKGWWWGRKELELTGSAFLTEQLSTDDYSRNCYLCFMQEAKPVGEIVLPSLHVGNEASPGKLFVWGTVWNILWTNLPSMTWQALLKHAWDLQIATMQELKLSGRPSQVTDSSPCFYRDRILRGCIDTALWCAQCFWKRFVSQFSFWMGVQPFWPAVFFLQEKDGLLILVVVAALVFVLGAEVWPSPQHATYLTGQELRSIFSLCNFLSHTCILSSVFKVWGVWGALFME